VFEVTQPLNRRSLKRPPRCHQRDPSRLGSERPRAPRIVERGRPISVSRVEQASDAVSG
jgi:hypothetical protein